MVTGHGYVKITQGKNRNAFLPISAFVEGECLSQTSLNGHIWNDQASQLVQISTVSKWQGSSSIFPTPYFNNVGGQLL